MPFMLQRVGSHNSQQRNELLASVYSVELKAHSKQHIAVMGVACCVIRACSSQRLTCRPTLTGTWTWGRKWTSKTGLSPRQFLGPHFEVIWRGQGGFSPLAVGKLGLGGKAQGLLGFGQATHVRIVIALNNCP